MLKGGLPVDVVNNIIIAKLSKGRRGRKPGNLNKKPVEKVT
jgi:hypothetical protein